MNFMLSVYFVDHIFGWMKVEFGQLLCGYENRFKSLLSNKPGYSNPIFK